jgi:hypothetical protein
MTKKLLERSWNCYQSLFSVLEQLKSIPNLPNKYSRENYSQLANLCNIKVKQESEPIVLDKIYINIFINQAIRITE